MIHYQNARDANLQLALTHSRAAIARSCALLARSIYPWEPKREPSEPLSAKALPETDGSSKPAR